jgi:hypothetical protein
MCQLIPGTKESRLKFFLLNKLLQETGYFKFRRPGKFMGSNGH